MNTITFDEVATFFHLVRGGWGGGARSAARAQPRSLAAAAAAPHQRGGWVCVRRGRVTHTGCLTHAGTAPSPPPTHTPLQPAERAAEQLGVGATVLKRICRKFGLRRWPYRWITKVGVGCVWGGGGGGRGRGELVLQYQCRDANWPHAWQLP